ncbi:zinc finger 36, C3H1 type-like 1 [Pelobates cultripes]|uniref:mRNA decay activator protein ZFP36 n=1 Tax=Pelobates cultripes TaxID=61616 RepID=A0AAD1WMP1_PELCU|nr:zinc finger 36, C3H1 type-like 1 [Pelobates cultripes]
MPSSLPSPFSELDTNFSNECLSLRPDVNINLNPCMRENHNFFSCPTNLNKNKTTYEQLTDFPLWSLENQNIEILPANSLRLIPFQAERSVSMIEDSTKQPGASRPLSSRYKTELCRTFHESGSCKYGSKCQFAHGTSELRGLNRHPKYKTELCRTYHTIGFCPYGSRCHFIHNADEQRFCDGNRRPGPPALRQSLSCSGIPSSSCSSNSLFSSVSSLSSFSPSTPTQNFTSSPFCSSSPITLSLSSILQSITPTYSTLQSVESDGIVLHLTPSPTEDPGLTETWSCLSKEENDDRRKKDGDSTSVTSQEAKRLPIFSKLSD